MAFRTIQKLLISEFDKLNKIANVYSQQRTFKNVFYSLILRLLFFMLRVIIGS